MVNVLMEGGRFDSDFYQDQVDPSARELVIETVRVRQEFVEAEKKLSDKKARRFARKLSALGQNKVVKEYCDDLPEISDEPDYEEAEKSPFKAPREIVGSTSRSTILKC